MIQPLNAMALLRRTAYGPEWCWVRMKRIRAVWLHLVARLTRHGRRVKLVLGAAGAHLLAARKRMLMEIVGERPAMESTSGFYISSRNWRA